MTMEPNKKPAISLGPTDVVTPPCRLAFASLFEARPRAPGSDRLTYQATLLIPSDADLGIYTSALRAAVKEAWGDQPVKLAADKNPIKDCAEKADLPGYLPGWHYINSHSGYRPQVVDKNRQEVVSPDVVYSGCWCRFHLKAFAYDHKVGGKGVSFSLEAVMFDRNDERFSGRRDAREVFAPFAESETAPRDLKDLFS